MGFRFRSRPYHSSSLLQLTFVGRFVGALLGVLVGARVGVFVGEIEVVPTHALKSALLTNPAPQAVQSPTESWRVTVPTSDRDVFEGQFVHVAAAVAAVAALYFPAPQITQSDKAS